MSASTSSQRVEFQERARQALSDVSLQRALAKARRRFVDHRWDSVGALTEFDAIRPCPYSHLTLPTPPNVRSFGR